MARFPCCANRSSALEKYPATFEGIAVETLRADIRGWLVALETELVAMPAIPQIRLAER